MSTNRDIATAKKRLSEKGIVPDYSDQNPIECALFKSDDNDREKRSTNPVQTGEGGDGWLWWRGVRGCAVGKRMKRRIFDTQRQILGVVFF
jgi:hypothetical protein